MSADTSAQMQKEAPSKEPETRLSVNQYAPYFESFEKVAKVAVAVVALLYGIGLLVTNQYLMQFSISDFSSLRPKYILTGTWSLLLLCIVMSPPFTALVALRETEGSTFSQRFVIVFFRVVSAVSIGVALVFLTYTALRMDMNHMWADFGGLSLGSVSLTLVILYFYRTYKNSDSSGSILALAVVTVAVLLILHQFAEKVYGRVPEAWGGGKPLTATLIFNNQGATVWQQAGMPLAGGLGSMNSEKVSVIYQGERNMVVEGSYRDQSQTTKKKVVIVNRNLVEVIVPEI